MTLLEVATAAHVSKAAVSKNKKINRRVNDDGTLFFDPADQTVQKFLNKHSAKPQKARPEPAPKKPAADPMPPGSEGTLGGDKLRQGERLLKLLSGAEPNEDLDDELKREKILTSKQNRAIRSREFIPREDMRQVFMRFYATQTAVLSPIAPVRGIEIAKALGRNDPEAAAITTQILDEAVFKALAEIKATMIQQLKNAGADK